MSEKSKKNGNNAAENITSGEPDQTQGEAVNSGKGSPGKIPFNWSRFALALLALICIINTTWLILLHLKKPSGIQDKKPPAAEQEQAVSARSLQVDFIYPRGENITYSYSSTDYKVFSSSTRADTIFSRLNRTKGSVSFIAVNFNRPIDPQCLAKDILTITPELKGELQLLRPETLIFIPSGSFTVATKYTVKINHENIIAADGTKLSRDETGSFSTPPLKLLEVRQIAYGPNERIVIPVPDGRSMTIIGPSSPDTEDTKGRTAILRFIFNDRVDPEVFERHLSLRYKEEIYAQVIYKMRNIRSSNIMVYLKGLKHPELVVKVAAGLKGVSGPLALRDDVMKDISLTKNLRVHGIEAHQYQGSEPYISIDLNNYVYPEEFKENLIIEPAVDVRIEQGYYRSDFDLKGDFKPGTSYTLTLRQGLLTRSFIKLKKDIVRKVFFDDLPPHLDFPRDTEYFSPNRMMKIPLKTVNVKDIDVEYKQLYSNNLVYMLHSGWRRYVAAESKKSDVKIKYKKNREILTLIDIQKIIGQKGKGIFYIKVKDAKESWRRNASMTAVVTDLGITARVNKKEVFVWVTSLSTGQPVPGAKILLYSYTNQVIGGSVSKEDGTVVFPVVGNEETPLVIVAKLDDDLSFVKLQSRVNRGKTHSGSPYVTEGYEGYSFAERGIYRPGDDVKLSILVRDKHVKAPKKMPVELKIIRPGNKEFIKKNVVLQDGGIGTETVNIPVSMQTGIYRVYWRIPGFDNNLAATAFRVEDYMPNLIKISVASPEGRQPAKETFKVTAKAEYLFGKPAEGLKVVARINFREDSFSPEKFKGYTFRSDAEIKRTHHRLEGITDKKGICELTIPASDMQSNAAVKSVVEIEVREKGGRPLYHTVENRLDPHLLYLGAKTEKRYIEMKQETGVDLAAVKPDGELYTQEIEVKGKLERVSYTNIYRYRHRRYSYEHSKNTEVEKTFKTALTDGRAQITFEPQHTGRYILTLTPDKGNPTVLEFYAYGEGVTAGWAIEYPDRLMIELDKGVYNPGETASLIIKSPFKGKLLLTVEGEKILSRRILDLADFETKIELPIKEAYRPNVYVCGTVIRPVEARKTWTPHSASGSVLLRIDNTDRRMDCALDVQENIRPLKKLKCSFTLTQNGRPQAYSDVLVFAVDEGVLRLTGYKLPDPGLYFYRLRSLGINEYSMYRSLAPILEEWKAEKRSAPGGGSRRMEELAKRLNPIQVKRVKTAVLYSGFVKTDDTGSGTVELDVPNYIGELRLMVISAKDRYFDAVEKSVKVRSPVMVQTVLPRFMSPGDKAYATVTIFNESEKAGAIRLTGKSEGPVDILPGYADLVTLDPGGEHTVMVPISALDEAGKAKARFSVSMENESHYAETEFAVRPAAPLSHAVSDFTLNKGEGKIIGVNGTYYKGTHTSHVILGGNPFIKLLPRLQRLVRYPYGCVEQTTSKLFPMIYLRDIADYLDERSLNGLKASYFVREGIHKLHSMARDSGGLGYWPGSYGSPYYYGSIYAADCLIEARKAGYSIEKEFMENLLEYIEEGIEERIKSNKYGSAGYACYVLAKTGDAPLNWMNRIKEFYDKGAVTEKGVAYSDHSGIFNLALAYFHAGKEKEAQALLRKHKVIRTDFARQMGGYLSSPLRYRSKLLLAYLDMDPADPLLKTMAAEIRRLLDQNPTTQESAFAILALGKYYRYIEKPSKSLKASIVYPDGREEIIGYKDTVSYKGLTPEKTMKITVSEGDNLHVTILEEGVPLSGKVREGENRISVERKFYDAQTNKEVTDFTFEQGKLYYAVLKINPFTSVRNMIVCDLLPAGMEIDAMTAPFGSPETRTLTRLAPIHVEKRDDRMLAFVERQVSRKCMYAYMVRAVTQGKFVLPPVEVSCMYDPAIYCIKGSGSITIIKERPVKPEGDKD